MDRTQEREVQLPAGALDAFRVEVSDLDALYVVSTTDVSDSGVDVVGVTVDGKVAVTVAASSKLYVFLKNATGSPVTATLSVGLVELLSSPPE